MGGDRAEQIGTIIGYQGRVHVDAIGFSGGDFNDTRFTWERNSASDETNRRSARFNEWVESMELEFSGASHTWARGNSIETRRSARLDRALCNGEWALKFENAKVKHLPAVQSDHCPIIISPNGFAPLEYVNRPFRFQPDWMTHDHFDGFVNANWDSKEPFFPMLQNLASKLQRWNKEHFHNIFREKRRLIARIEGIQRALVSQRHGGLIKL
ncbi:GTP-binding protein TypA/BipA-like protein [Bienertia sinuspersici]